MGDVMMESYRKSSGKEKVTKSEAVAAIKSAGRNDLANTMRACLKDGKTYATCRPLVRQKLRQSKSWDNRTKTNAEVIATNDENENDDAELERETKLGAMSVCRLDYRECRKLAMKKPTVEAKTSEKICRTSFKTCFSSIYPKANADKKMIEKAKRMARVQSVKERLEAAKVKAKENGVFKTKKEVLEMIT